MGAGREGSQVKGATMASDEVKSEGEEKPPFDPATTVDMKHERIFCTRHGEIFRAKWPSGFLLFALPSIQYLLEQDGYFQAEVKKRTDAGDEFPRACEKVLDEKPVCCRLPSRVLVERYEYAGCQKGNPVFVEAKCFNCRKVAVGAPYRISHGSTTQYIPHVCVRCVVYQMEPG